MTNLLTYLAFHIHLYHIEKYRGQHLQYLSYREACVSLHPKILSGCSENIEPLNYRSWIGRVSAVVARSLLTSKVPGSNLRFGEGSYVGGDYLRKLNGMSRLKRIYLIGSIVLLLAPVFVIHYQDGLYTNIHNDKAFDSERFALRKLNSDVENFDTSPGRMFRGESKERTKYIIDYEAIKDDRRSIENKTLGGFGNKYLRANHKLTEGENRMENNVGRRHNSPGPPPLEEEKFYHIHKIQCQHLRHRAIHLWSL
ncbi:hypothetical protein FSP39_022894 [Pinctada imbricata]|uniref:Uncharacterized protein n=1 Tax=Pinctada imbricata TaxID=66713 RepID=A0AA88YFQ6_PINIB|nr:hypothetical protein FSP39_022894 [Pinctada imbricata]